MSIYIKRKNNNILWCIFTVLTCLFLFNIKGMFYLFGNASVNAIKLLFFLVVIISYISKKKFAKPLISLSLLFLVVVINTQLHNDSAYLAFQRFVPLIVMYMLLENNKNRLNEFLKVEYICLECVVWINFIIYILYPDGWFINGITRNWFIGQKQDFSEIFLPACVLGFWFLRENRIKLIRYIVLLAMILYQAFGTMTLGTVVSIMAFGSAYIFITFNGKNVSKRGAAGTLFTMVLIIQIILMAFAIAGRVTLFAGYLETIVAGQFTKFDTLSIRALLWNNALRFFEGSPIFGIGIIGEDRSWLFEYVSYYPNFHNILFDLMATSGIVGVAYYFWLNIKNASIYKKVVQEQEKVLLAAVFAVNILFLTEAMYFPALFEMFYLGFIIKKSKSVI